MGWGKKQVSPEVGAFEHLKEMDDSAIKALMKQHKVTAFKSPKELRKAADKVGFKGLEGERGMQALLAGLKGGGTGNRNHQNIPAKDRVHPSVANRRKQELNQKIQQAIRSGDRQEQVKLRSQAQREGYL